MEKKRYHGKKLPFWQRLKISSRKHSLIAARLSAPHLRNAVENQQVLQQKCFKYQFPPDYDIMVRITVLETMVSMLSDLEALVSEL